eukprot:2273452-Amphidinium_carterae.1
MQLHATKGVVRDQSEEQECDQSRSSSRDSAELRSTQSDSTSRTSYLKSSRETEVSSRHGQMTLTNSSAKRSQTIRQPITDANVISGYRLEAESERFVSLNKVILHRWLSMTEGESHALVQSLIYTTCGYEAWRQLNVQYSGGSVARQYTKFRLILSPTWGNHNNASEMLKHYTQSLQTIQGYETTHNTKINDDIKIASVVNSVRGQLRTHLLLNMDETTSFDDVKKTIGDFIQSTYVIQQTHSGGQGQKRQEGQRKSKGPPVKAKEKVRKAKNQNQIQQWGQSQQKGYQPSQYQTQYQQPSGKGKGKGKSSITCWTCGRTSHTSNQCWWKGPIYQLDATDSAQPPMPLESGTLMTSQSANEHSQSSDHVSGLWNPSPIIIEIIGTIMDIHNRVKEDSCCKIISQSDVKRCGQKWTLMYDSGAAMSVVPLSFAPHVPLQPIRGDQKLQSVTDAEIKTHGFKKCTIIRHWTQSELHHL